MYPLSIKKLRESADISNRSIESYLTNDLRWLCVVDRLQVLLHGTIVLSLLIQMVSILPENNILLLRFHARLLRQIDGKGEEIPLIENLEALLERFFVISVYLHSALVQFWAIVSILADLSILCKGEEVTPYHEQ